eukprot:9180206-Lingulodinium_polyedra.AAC.1
MLTDQPRELRALAQDRGRPHRATALDPRDGAGDRDVAEERARPNQRRTPDHARARPRATPQKTN